MSIYDKSSLVLIPSGTKTGKVFSQKPVSGDGDFTFTRASAATRVNADGNIEKETSNLLLQSNQFDTTWSALNTTLAGGQAGYDGSTNAWKITAVGTGGGRKVQQQISTSGVISFSVYAKAGTANYIALECGGTGGFYEYFSLVDGTDGAGLGNIDVNAEDVGNDWWRFTIVGNPSSLSSVNIFASNTNNATDISDGQYIYIQDAQVNQGLIAQEVLTTTTAAVYGGITDNTPRLDYTDSSCPALLLEPSRTNNNNQSEYFGAWSANATITANADISPEGVRNAYNIASNSGVGNGILKIIGVLSSTQYVCSIYVKSAGATTGKLRLFDGSTGASTTTTFTPTSEWQRVEVTRTSGSSTFQFRIDIHSNDGDLLIYGAQLEAGSYATSYIPTYGSSVSRVVDACLGAGDASTFNSTEGVLFWEGSFDSTSTTAGAIAIIGSGSNRVQLYNSGTSLVVLIQVDGVSVFGASTSGTIDITSNHKYAVKWGLNDFAFWIDGVEYSTNTSGATFSNNTLNELRFSDLYTNYLYANTKQVLTFNTALSNEELAALTTI